MSLLMRLLMEKGIIGPCWRLNILAAAAHEALCVYRRPVNNGGLITCSGQTCSGQQVLLEAHQQPQVVLELMLVLEPRCVAFDDPQGPHAAAVRRMHKAAWRWRGIEQWS